MASIALQRRRLGANELEEEERANSKRHFTVGESASGVLGGALEPPTCGHTHTFKEAEGKVTVVAHGLEDIPPWSHSSPRRSR